MKREEGYIDSLNLNIKTQSDIDVLLCEFEVGKISRDELMALLFLAHSVSSSKGFSRGFESAKKAFESAKKMYDAEGNIINRKKL